jgi:hypothetical protein
MQLNNFIGFQEPENIHHVYPLHGIHSVRGDHVFTTKQFIGSNTIQYHGFRLERTVIDLPLMIPLKPA